jgi:mRNA-degrading endonuclease toxin of MazEF toxin-antitoxin module
MKVGDVVLMRLSTGSGGTAKRRPILIVAELPGVYPAFLVCGISSKVDRIADDWDIVIGTDQDDLATTGLKITSVIRPSWLASIPRSSRLDHLGSVRDTTITLVRERIASALANTPFTDNP